MTSALGSLVLVVGMLLNLAASTKGSTVFEGGKRTCISRGRRLFAGGVACLVVGAILILPGLFD